MIKAVLRSGIILLENDPRMTCREGKAVGCHQHIGNVLREIGYTTRVGVTCCRHLISSQG